MNVSGQHGKIALLIYKDALISPLIKMAYSLVPPVIMRGIGNIKPPHEFTKIGKRGLKKEMEVVFH